MIRAIATDGKTEEAPVWAAVPVRGMTTQKSIQAIATMRDGASGTMTRATEMTHATRSRVT